MSVDCNFTFSYADLRDNIEGCLRIVGEKYKCHRKVKGKKKIRGQKRRKNKELEELKGYMLEFVSDVEDSEDVIHDEYIEDPEGRRIVSGDW